MASGKWAVTTKYLFELTTSFILLFTQMDLSTKGKFAYKTFKKLPLGTFIPFSNSNSISKESSEIIYWCKLQHYSTPYIKKFSSGTFIACSKQ